MTTGKRDVKERVAEYVRAMEAAWEIWGQYGRNPMSFPYTFLGMKYQENDSFEMAIRMGHQPRILIEDVDLAKWPEEYIHVDTCMQCGKWKLVSGGTGSCEVCDGEIDKDEWDAELARLGKTWMETKTRRGKPYSVNWETHAVTVYKDPDAENPAE